MYNKQDLEQFNILTEEARQTGRTYQLVTRAIAKAVANPNKEVHLVFRDANMRKHWVNVVKKENSSFKIPNLKFFTHTGHIRKYGILGEYGKQYSEFVYYDHEVVSAILSVMAKHLHRFTDVRKNAKQLILGE